MEATPKQLQPEEEREVAEGACADPVPDLSGRGLATHGCPLLDDPGPVLTRVAWALGPRAGLGLGLAQRTRQQAPGCGFSWSAVRGGGRLGRFPGARRRQTGRCPLSLQPFPGRKAAPHTVSADDGSAVPPKLSGGGILHRPGASSGPRLRRTNSGPVSVAGTGAQRRRRGGRRHQLNFTRCLAGRRGAVEILAVIVVEIVLVRVEVHVRPAGGRGDVLTQVRAQGKRPPVSWLPGSRTSPTSTAWSPRPSLASRAARTQVSVPGGAAHSARTRLQGASSKQTLPAPPGRSSERPGRVGRGRAVPRGSLQPVPRNPRPFPGCPQPHLAPATGHPGADRLPRPLGAAKQPHTCTCAPPVRGPRKR